jgi:hypothetical protein
MRRENRTARHHRAESKLCDFECDDNSNCHRDGFRFKNNFLSVEKREEVYNMLMSSETITNRSDETDIHCTEFGYYHEFEGGEKQLAMQVVAAIRGEVVKHIPRGSKLNTSKLLCHGLRQNSTSNLLSLSEFASHCGRYSRKGITNATERREKLGGALTAHVDGDGDHNILSAIYTVHSNDCYGGVVRYAHNQSGLMDSKKRKVVMFIPWDNSLYFFPGSYVQHSVSSVTSGVRMVIVVFFRWQGIKPYQVVQYWMNGVCQCRRCLHVFKTKEAIRIHQLRFKEIGCEHLKHIVIK